MRPPRSCARWRARRPSGRTKAQLVARYRPRHFGRAGVAAAGGQARLWPEDVLARPVEDRPARQRDAGRHRQFRSRQRRPASWRCIRRAASFGQITGLVAPFAPSLAARLNALGASPGPARVKLALDLDKTAGQADRGNARAVLDLDAPQLKGITTITAKPPVAGDPQASISMRSGAANSASTSSCHRRRAAPCWRCSASTAPSPPATARRNSKARRRAHGVRRCG